MGFAPTWLRQVSPLLHMTSLTTAKKFVFFFAWKEACFASSGWQWLLTLVTWQR